MEHPDLNFLIQREIQRDRIEQARVKRQMPIAIPTHPLRRTAGAFLIAVGTRLAPSPRQAAGRPAIGGVALAGRIDR
jgi:hypothetical protein